MNKVIVVLTPSFSDNMLLPGKESFDNPEKWQMDRPDMGF